MQYEAQPINLFNGYGYIYFLKRVFAQTHVVANAKKIRLNFTIIANK